MEAIDHEAETVLTKKTHHHKITLARWRNHIGRDRSVADRQGHAGGAFSCAGS